MTVSDIQEACERLVHDYAWTQDNGEAEAFAALFAPDAVWLRPGKDPLLGREAILENARSTFLKTLQEKALHCITNFRLQVSDEGPSSTAYSIAFSGNDGGAGFSQDCQPVGAMIYRNRFKLVDGAWKISQHQTEFRFKR